MKVALISDIHGNLHALQAVLDDIERAGVDRIACLGDLVTLGPNPREVLALMQGLGCPCVLGNHEEAIFSPDRALEYGIPTNLFSTLRWCIDLLSPSDLNFLRSATNTATIEIEGLGKILLYHGSPRSRVEGIYSETSNTELDRIFSGVDGDLKLAAGGHTHVQMLRQHRNLLIANPGSVGDAFVHPLIPNQPPQFYPFAEYAIVTLESRSVSVELRQVRFDLRAFAREVLDSSLPLRDWWQEQFKRLGTLE